MGFKKEKETFDEFLARFTTAKAPLSLSEVQKISTLRRTINNRLRYRILDGNLDVSFIQLVTHLRKLNLDLRQADHISKGSGGSDRKAGESMNKFKSKVKDKDKDDDTVRGSSQKSAGSINKSYPRYPSHVADRLQKEGRCFKCLKTGHRATDAGAPCKEVSALTADQIAIQLKAVGIQIQESDNGEDLIELKGYSKKLKVPGINRPPGPKLDERLWLSSYHLNSDLSLMEGRQLDFNGAIQTPSGYVKSPFLTDTGASALSTRIPQLIICKIA